MPKTLSARIFPSLQLLVVLAALALKETALAALPAAMNGEPLPSLAPVLDRVTPSVVNIYTETRVQVRSPLMDDPVFRRFFNVPERARERISRSLGSGVIVDAEKGYVLTNNHVIEGSTGISVTLHDGRSLTADVIGSDPDTDLAMIRIQANDLDALPMANSDELRVGDFVVAVGNPFGLGQTVTSGIVSALGRTGFRGLEFQNFIQTDASINPGNSGGALINLRGELVGINSAIFTPSGGNVGIGFAIPSSMARYVMDQLAQFGEVRRGTLGIFVQDLTGELAGALGVEVKGGALVAEVVPGSAAARAGIEPGDVIVSVAELPVASAQDFHNIEGQLPVGQRAELEYLRDSRARSASLDVEALRTLQGDTIDQRFAGALFEDLPAKVRAERVRGVLISELGQDSRLARQGLRPGDIITGVNRTRVSSLAEFEEAVEQSGGQLTLQLRRNRSDYVARID